jgi:hypothetical protein
MVYRPVLFSMWVNVETLVLRSPMNGVDRPHKAVGMRLRSYAAAYNHVDHDLSTPFGMPRLWFGCGRGLVVLTWVSSTGSALPPCRVARRRDGRPLRLARLLEGGMVGCSASQGVGRSLRLAGLLDEGLVGRSVSQGWSAAPPRRVARQRIGRPLCLAGLLGGGWSATGPLKGFGPTLGTWFLGTRHCALP